MKSKKIKKLLAATLTATLMMATTLTAAAASGGSSGSSGTSEPAEEKVETAAEENNGSGSSVTVVSSGSSVTMVPSGSSVTVVSSNARMTVAGTEIRTTVAGAYEAKTVQGAAITTPTANIMANLGLTSGQTPYIMLFDTDLKKSNLAMNCVNAAAKALNGSVVASLNIDLGAKQNGKFVTLSKGCVDMVVGLPKNADTSKSYSVVCVQPGGVITILEDKDASPETVTFEVKAGLGTYGIVAE